MSSVDDVTIEREEFEGSDGGGSGPGFTSHTGGGMGARITATGTGGVARVVAPQGAHVYALRFDNGRGWRAECTCGWLGETRDASIRDGMFEGSHHVMQETT